MREWFFAALFCVGSALGSATFERVDFEHLLPQSSINAMLQDRRGFIWFATREGVARWDGRRMRIFKHDPFDEASLPGNIIHELLEDCDGNIWAWTVSASLNYPAVARIVVSEDHRIERFDHPESMVVNQVDRDGKNCETLLVGPAGIHRFDFANSEFRFLHKRALTSGVSATFADDNGSLWLGGMDGVIERCAAAQCAVVHVPDDPAGSDVHVFFPHGGGMIAARSGRGLLELSLPDIRELKAPWDHRIVSDIRVGSGDTRWLVSTDAVYETDAAFRDLSRHTVETEGGRPNRNLDTLLIDDAGSIWLGSVWGLYRHDPQRGRFGHLGREAGRSDSLSGGLVMSILEDSRGWLWVGTFGSGLDRYNPVSGRVRHYSRQELSAGSETTIGVVWGLAEDSIGRIWLATDHGLVGIDPVRETSVRVARTPTVGLPGNVELVGGENVAHALVPAATGDKLWVGFVGHGVHMLDPLDLTLEPLDARLPGFVTTMLDDGRQLWVGSSDQGVVARDHRSGKLTALGHDPASRKTIAHRAVRSLVRSNTRTMWVGTDAGLTRIQANGEVTQFSAADGLAGDVIFTLREDRSGAIWLSTNRGLSRIDNPEAVSPDITTFNQSHGIENLEFNRGASWQGRDGVMYFGGDRGVTLFHPGQFLSNGFLPPIQVTRAELSSGSGTRVLEDPLPDPLIIVPEENSFGFEFAALSFVNPDRNRFRVRLNGVDEINPAYWVELSQRSRIDYTNVRPGTYELHVQGSNEDGLWNTEGARLTLVVRPTFAESLPFRVGAGLAAFAVVALIVWVVAHSRYRRRLERLEHQQALLAEKQRISRDMHDEVGASLTEIAITTEIAVRDGHMADEELLSIADQARRTLRSIGDLVWAVDPRNDELQRLATHCRETAVRILENAKIAVTFDIQVSDGESSVNGLARRGIHLILTEALTNITRHSGASEARLEIQASAGRWDMTVRDNGPGFDPDKGPAGNGLCNMRARAAELDGRLKIESGNEGTSLRLSLVLA